MDGAILMFLWLFGTTGIAVAAVVFGLLTILRNRSRLVKSFLSAIVYLAVSIVAVLSNPIVNWRLFHHHRENVIASMLAEIETPATAISARYGVPHSIVTDADSETWRYWPSPCYVLLRWEEVLFRMQDGRVVAAFVDD
jgi:hypothetical protein